MSHVSGRKRVPVPLVLLRGPLRTQDGGGGYSQGRSPFPPLQVLLRSDINSVCPVGEVPRRHSPAGLPLPQAGAQWPTSRWREAKAGKEGLQTNIGAVRQGHEN